MTWRAYAPAGAPCESAGAYAPTLAPFIKSDTATGQFVVERDRYVDG